MEFFYRAYGFHIVSELEIPEFRSAAANNAAPRTPDICIDVGDVPREIAAPAVTMEDYQVGTGEILLTIPSVARYWARDGQRLTIAPERGADPKAVLLYLKGSGLAAILHQRGILPLHASAIEHDGSCVAFLGDSGAGKSTLAGMLGRRGYRIISDDVLVVRIAADNVVLACAGPPVIKLWPESLDPTGFAEAHAPFEYAEFRKHRITANDKFAEGALPVSRLYVLRWLLPLSADSEIATLTPFDAMVSLRTNIYRAQLVAAMRREQAFMSFTSALMSRAALFRFSRPCLLSRAELQIDALERHLQGVAKAVSA